MNDLISVIMPAYNCEKYIENSVNSVLTQSYTNFELIIIDDASTDNTVNIVKNIMEKDTRVKLVKNVRNIGVALTRDRGIEHAEGEWIAFLDSDDIWRQEKLEEQMKVYEETNSNFIFTGSSFMNEEGEMYYRNFHVPRQVSYKQLLKQNVISCSSVMIKKEYLVKYKMQNDKIHEDFGVWLRVLKQEKIVAFGLNQPLIIYRIYKKSKSGNKFKSFVMTFRTYRFINLNLIQSLYYLSWYSVTGLIKYRKILK